MLRSLVPFKVLKIWSLVLNKLTNATRSRSYKSDQVAECEYEATEISFRTQASCRCCHLPFVRHMRSAKFFFLITCMSLAFSLLWVQFVTRPDERAATEKLIHEALENVGRDHRYKDVYRKTDSLPKDFKYMLLWTETDFAPLSYFGNGQRKFLENNCSVAKCYVTANRSFFGGDLTMFDAIAFNGRIMKFPKPSTRSLHQIYIYFNTESASNYPVCDARFDGFFNWTATYRLNSDIPFTYIQIRNKKGRIVGPKRKMRWKRNVVRTVQDDFIDRLRIQNKTKAAAWFVSNCWTKGGRKGFAKALANALKPYGFTIDVYGRCGTLSCPSSLISDCGYLLKKDYYFYMSLENSFDEDYVTEKLLTALNNDVIPIVYGGAKYSRFLPPGSYINGRKQHVKQLASMMNKLIHSPEEYNKYFWWKHHYTYSNPGDTDNLCAVCQALHDKKMRQTTTYDDFRHWWRPNYETLCPRWW